MRIEQYEATWYILNSTKVGRQKLSNLIIGNMCTFVIINTFTNLMYSVVYDQLMLSSVINITGHYDATVISVCIESI